MVFAHGLGAKADVQTAIDICRNLDVVAMSLSDRGLGGSEGRPSCPPIPELLFVGQDDIRRNWLYSYVYAILRTITFAQTLPEVDSQAIALTGFSLGGIATFIANGVDDHCWRPAGRGQRRSRFWQRGETLAASSRFSALQQCMAQQPPTARQPTPDPASSRLPIRGAGAVCSKLDPLRYARRQSGGVHAEVGAQDEYFRLPQVLRPSAACAVATTACRWSPTTTTAGTSASAALPAACPGRWQPLDGSKPAPAADCPPHRPVRRPRPSRCLRPLLRPRSTATTTAPFLACWSALLPRARRQNHVADHAAVQAAPPSHASSSVRGACGSSRWLTRPRAPPPSASTAFHTFSQTGHAAAGGGLSCRAPLPSNVITSSPG